MRRLTALEALWNERRGGRPCPSRADFSWADLRPWIGHLELIDVRPDATLEVRLWGLSIIDYFGRDLTRRALAACLSPSERTWFEGPYRTALADRAPVALATLLPVGFGTARPIERLILPLSSDGARIDMLMGAAFAHERALQDPLPRHAALAAWG